MLVSSGGETSIQANETWPGRSDAPPPSEPPTRPAARRRTRRDVAVRCGILAALMLGYRASFSTLHGLVGNSAFLPGLCICLLAAAWLGVRGALVVIDSVALIDAG